MLTIAIEQEEDGRWIAEVPVLPGALACRVIADLIEHGKPMPDEARAMFAPA